MKLNMILADSDPVYTEVLAARLQSRLPNVHISRCCDPAALRAAIANQKTLGGAALFLYNASDFHELKHLAAADIWPQGWQARPLLADHARGADGDAKNQAGFYRYEPVGKLIEQLREQFDLEAETPKTGSVIAGPGKTPSIDLVAPDSLESLEPDAGSAETNGKISTSGLWLLFSVGPDGYDARIARQRLVDLVNQGCQVFYLPLMPTYQMTCVTEPGQGPNLSDLLMHLIGQDPTSEQLGRYCRQHPDGYFQFRPPDRTDDLVLCQPDTLRLLVRKLREHVLRQPGISVAVIDCAGMPLSTVAVVAVLCDSCECSLPKRSGFAAEAARMEASRLFAALPPGCRIMKSWTT